MLTTPAPLDAAGVRVNRRSRLAEMYGKMSAVFAAFRGCYDGTPVLKRLPVLARKAAYQAIFPAGNIYQILPGRMTHGQYSSRFRPSPIRTGE
jgi:hypothetical protein